MTECTCYLIIALIFSCSLHSHVGNEDERVAELTKKSTSPTPITTGELKNIDELYLVSEAMVACRFNPPKHPKCSSYPTG